MTTLSVIITTYNEENNVPMALESVRWADERIVVDGYSSDHTIKRIQSIATRIVQSANHEQLNINKNLGFSMANSEWILCLDADERITESLATKIREILKEPDCDAYRFPRRNYFLGKWIMHGGWYPDYQVRLFRRDKGIFECKHVHESLTVHGTVGTIDEPIIHYSYPTLYTYFAKFERYTNFEARFMTAPRFKEYFLEAPCRHFIQAIVVRAGFRDGWRGLFIAFF
jgi:glycosyltransferase involved in cell wall biosynthesis